MKKKDPKELAALQGFAERDELASAMALCRKLLRKHPGDPELLLAMGQLAFRAADYKSAAEFLRRAMGLMPARQEAHLLHGMCLMYLGDLSAALLALDKAVQLFPDSFDLYNNRSVIRRMEGLTAEALEDCDRALRIDASHPAVYNNRGIVYMDLHRYDLAQADFEVATRYAPDYPDAHYNLGRVLAYQGRYEQGLAELEQAIRLQPDHSQAHLEKAFALYRKGFVAEFWQLYAIWRWVGKEEDLSRHNRACPEWHPHSTARRLLVWGEQGVGDEVLYCSTLASYHYAASLTVAADARLLPILERSFPDIQFIDRQRGGSVEASCESQISLGGLARYLRPDSASFSLQPVSFLQADPEKSDHFRRALQSAAPAALRCGVAWRSSNPVLGQDKSCKLEYFMGLLSVPGIQLIDLQYGDTAAEREHFLQLTGTEILSDPSLDRFHDLDGLCALIAACDVVVTTSNVTAHLAAALGKPTCVMVPSGAGQMWYWHHDQGYCPWYPTARICEQPTPGDWVGAIHLARQQLAGENMVMRGNANLTGKDSYITSEYLGND